MKNESSSKETPYFDYELEKWLVLYSIGNGPHEFKDVRGKMQKILEQEIVPLILVNIISGLQSEGCVQAIVRNEPIYKQEGNILKHLGDITEDYYSLTKKGKEQLLFRWEFFASAIPKDFYKEISNSIRHLSELNI